MIQPEKFTERRIEISGALTGAIVSHLETQLLFRPSRVTGEYEHLTWEVVPPQIGGYAFMVKKLTLATAEGIASLAAAVHALRRSDVRTTIDIVSDTDGWSKAAGLERLQTSMTDNPAEIVHPIVPLHAAPNDSRGHRQMYIQEMAEKTKVLLKTAGDLRSVDKADALAAVATEALLNVAEHAYLRKGENGPAFVAMTLTRPPLANESDVFTSEERTWFSRIRGKQYLEISIADCGSNVAYTLARQFRAKFPDIFERLDKTTSRAELHREIALWSFHPQSTRKSREEFASDIARLNWRGLHTALRRTADHDGAIIIHTGRTRLGYICSDARPFEFSHNLNKTREFPGTILTLRLPISTSTPKLPKPPKRPKKTDTRLALQTIIELDQIESLMLETETFHSPAPIGIALPYQYLRDSLDTTKLRVQLEPLPPHIVPVFLPAKGTESAWVGLAAFSEHDGAPRLAGFAIPGEPIQWKLIGTYPKNVAALVKTLENEGWVDVTTVDRPFAEMLRRAYSEQFTMANNVLSNTWHGWQIDDDTAVRAMQTAFDSWFALSLKEVAAAGWLFGSSNQCILLRSGRHVRRYLSVMRLLDSNELLARSVAWRLVTLLDHIGNGRKPMIVTDSEASYFRLATLLRDVDRPFDISIRRAPEAAKDRPIVLFADAVYRGDTVRSLIKTAKRADHVIVCLDLSPTEPTFDVSFTALLRGDFDAEELKSVPPEMEVLECDVVTNVPEPKAATERFNIGTSPARQKFVESHPSVVRHGLQRAGGRTHTVTLPCRAVLEYGEQVLNWLDETATVLTQQLGAGAPPPPLVVFYRTDAEISRVLPAIANRFEQQFDEVFGVPLPFIAAGSREAFARTTPRLLAGIRRLGAGSMFSARPSRPYLALYVDDACVTGRTLFNFIVRVARTAGNERPMGLIVTPVVTRLSPTEEYFFSDICRHIGSEDRTIQNDPIPFAFAPLFRLQVGSLVPADAVPINHFLTEFSRRRDILDDRSQRYAQKVVERADQVFYSERATINETPVIAHPFYLSEDGEQTISFRAIRIRQLLSLHEQNVGVLGELLHAFFLAFEEKDYDVLSVLALEPRLLEVRPVHTACWRGLTELALSALTSATSDTLKSDALAVLALQRDVFVKSLDLILPTIGHSTALVEQLVTFLYQLAASTPVPRAQTLLAYCANWTREEQRYLLRTLASIDRLTAHVAIKDESDAWNRLLAMVSRFLFHAASQDHLTNFNDWVKRDVAARRATPKAEIAKLATAAIDVLDSDVRQGLDVLEWLAKNRMDVDVVRRIREERPKLVHAISELQDLVGAIVGRTVGSRDANLAAVWERIQRYSLVRSAELILPEPEANVVLPSFPSEAPLIEDVLPRYVSSPARLLHSLASKRIALEFQPRGSGNLYFVIAPAPSPIVQNAFELILGDMRKHGEPGSQKATAVVDMNRRKLVITFQDQTRTKDKKGSERSQAIVSNLAEEGGFLVRFDRPVAAGSLYKVTVEFPRVVAIEINQLR